MCLLCLIRSKQRLSSGYITGIHERKFIQIFNFKHERINTVNIQSYSCSSQRTPRILYELGIFEVDSLKNTAPW